MKKELIEIYINNQKVIIESDTKMTEKKYLWEENQGDTFEGAGDNLQIVIPAIKENQKLFSLRNYLEVNKKLPIEFGCKIYYAGLKRCDGIFVLTKIYRDKYEGFVTQNSFNQFADKSITDISVFNLESYNIGTNSTSIVANMKLIIQNNHALSTKIQFPYIFTEDIFIPNNDAFNLILNDSSFADFYTNSWVNDDINGLQLRRHSIIAIPYLMNVLSQLFNSVNWTISGDFISHAYYSKIQILHNRLLDNLVLIPRFKFIGSYTNETTIANNSKVELYEEYDYDNCFDELTNYSYEFKQLGVYEVSFTGKIKVNASLTASYVAITVKFSHLNTPGQTYVLLNELYNVNKNTYYDFNFKKLVTVDRKIVNGVEESGSMINQQVQLVIFGAATSGGSINDISIKNTNCQVRCLSHERINDYKGTFTLNELLPKVTLNEFLSAIKENFAVEIIFDTAKKNAEFKLKQNIFNDKKVFKIPNHWVEYGNYFKEFQNKIFAFKFDISDEYIKEINQSEIITTVDTYTQLPEVQIGKFAVVYTQNIVYKGILIEQENADPIKKWEEFCHYHFYYQVDDTGAAYKLSGYSKVNETTEILPKCQPALMKGESSLIFPKLDGTAESFPFDTGEQSCNIKFMFDHGYDNSYYYRVSSSMRYNNSLTPVTDRDLTWSSLYNASKAYYDFIRTAQKVTLYLKLKPGEYYQLLKVFEPSIDSNHPRWLLEPSSNLLLLPIQFTANLDSVESIINLELICLQKYHD